MTDTLEAGRIDRWDIQLFEGDTLFLYGIAPVPADIVLSIYKDGQPLINKQNSAPAGSPEFINAPQLQGAGIYQIHVETTAAVSTEYALVVNNDPEFPVILSGIITPGSPRNAMQIPAFGIHVWFFIGNAGDVVGIRARPNGNDMDPAA